MSLPTATTHSSKLLDVLDVLEDKVAKDLFRDVTSAANTGTPMFSIAKSVAAYVFSEDPVEREAAKADIRKVDPRIDAVAPKSADERLQHIQQLGLASELPKVAGVDVRRLLEQEIVSPFNLIDMLDEVTAREWRDMEPETIRDHFKLREDWTVDRVMALQVIATNPDVTIDWDLFHHVACAINRVPCNFASFEPLALPQYVLAALVIKKRNPAGEIRPEVLEFLKQLMIHDGWVYLPWLDLSIGSVDDPDLLSELSRLWAAGLDDVEVPDKVPEKDSLQVQLKLLLGAKQYLKSFMNA